MGCNKFLKAIWKLISVNWRIFNFYLTLVYLLPEKIAERKARLCTIQKSTHLTENMSSSAINRIVDNQEDGCTWWSAIELAGKLLENFTNQSFVHWLQNVYSIGIRNRTI